MVDEATNVCIPLINLKLKSEFGCVDACPEPTRGAATVPKSALGQHVYDGIGEQREWPPPAVAKVLTLSQAESRYLSVWLVSALHQS